ncbi:glyoxalase [uncultured Nocardioides sp.]|uniref:glyoxalase n=1 Tax=uncultured Nocardioides sp. TaxID=198441 RepID=UPI002605E03E|nr:glyoxalase [uncultured Nocardioides sp.]
MRHHHVQVCCPPGGEDVARRFWADGLGMTEVEKPEPLRARGGCWFRHPGGAEVHVGVEDPFAAAAKAHPAFVVGGVAALEVVGERLETLGFVVDRSERDTFPGFTRFHCFDGQGEGRGNRVELLADPG